MPYTPVTWVNTPSGGTNINAADLNHAELGIKQAHDIADTVTAQASQLLTDAATAQADANTAAATASTAQTTANGGVTKATVTTKGDLLAATASATLARQAAGANDRILKADSVASTGMSYGPKVAVVDTEPALTGYLDGDILFVRKS